MSYNGSNLHDDSILRIDTRTCMLVMSGFNWASTLGNLTLLLAKNKGADQPAHPRSLISSHVICYLKSIAVNFSLC